MNLRTSLWRRARAGCPMAAYDRLPPPLRAWLATAALPWSPQSALRIWRRAGGGKAGLIRLGRAEAALLARDTLTGGGGGQRQAPRPPKGRRPSPG
jgi:hypothetical protein